jgi:hypothetical protein
VNGALRRRWVFSFLVALSAGCEDGERPEPEPVLKCPTAETACKIGESLACAALDSDPKNCGCCGNRCQTGECRAGRCVDPRDSTFFVFGDAHVGPPGATELSRAGLERMHGIDDRPLALIDNGDLVDVAGETGWTLHDEVMSTSALAPALDCPLSFGEKPRYWASAGNHDVDAADWSLLWNRHLPGQGTLGRADGTGLYYGVSNDELDLFMLDSEHAGGSKDSFESDQSRWLEASLTGSTARFKVLLFHEPVYSCSGHHPPLAAALPWVDLAERHGVALVIQSHTHVYARSCPRRGGKCVDDGTGVVFLETGALGGVARDIDVESATVTGTDAAGSARTDAYDCMTGKGLAGALGLQNTFCHAEVNGCALAFDCYVVDDGTRVPFDSWTISRCD